MHHHRTNIACLVAATALSFTATTGPAAAWSDEIIEGENAPTTADAAEEAAPPEDEQPQAPVPASILARRRDASIDRGLTTGHAETIGANKWSINSYQIILFGVTYGFTNDFQMSLSTLLPIVIDIPLLLALTPKYVVHRGSNHALAIRGNIWFGSDIGSGFGLGMVSAGPVVDYYFDKAGRYGVHAGFSLGGAFGAGGDDFGFAEGLVLSADVGFTLGVARNVKLIVEGQMFGTYSAAGFNVTDIALVNYGVRFHGDGLAVDLGFIRPVGDVDSGPFVFGVPYVTFSARF